MNARGLRRYVDDLLRGRRPKGFVPDDFEAAQMRTAIELNAAVPGADAPSQDFLKDLRGRLAEQELLNESAQIAALQPLPLLQKRYIRPWFAATGRHPAVDEMAACMADTDPAGIMAVVRTTPGFADENAAIAAMSPALTKCLSAGTRLDASRQALRAALADALYQRLHNPALSMTQTGGTAH